MTTYMTYERSRVHRVIAPFGLDVYSISGNSLGNLTVLTPCAPRSSFDFQCLEIFLEI